jgi:hypothetical protein
MDSQVYLLRTNSPLMEQNYYSPVKNSLGKRGTVSIGMPQSPYKKQNTSTKSFYKNKTLSEEDLNEIRSVSKNVLGKFNGLPPAPPCKSLARSRLPSLAKSNLFKDDMDVDFDKGAIEEAKKLIKINPDDFKDYIVPLKKAYELYVDAVQKSTMKIGDKVVKLGMPMYGTYLVVFPFTCSKPIIPGINNDRLLVKIFNKEHTKNEKKIVALMTNSLKNYNDISKLNLPCSKIHNEATAVEDTKYIVDKIPSRVNIICPDQLQQVRKFFEVTIKNKVICDLSYTNLMVKKEFSGTVEKKTEVTLIDFAENELTMGTEKYDRFAIQFLKSWCNEIHRFKGREGREPSRLLLEYFVKDLTFNPECIERALDEHFPQGLMY